MPPHSGLVLALMALLALAGIQKIVDTRPTSGALEASGLPGSKPVVVALGVAEVAIGLTGMLLGGPLPALVASGFYAAFAVFVGNALMKDLPIRSCGCLGATETPPSFVHVIVNSVAAATMALAVVAPVDLLDGLATMAVSEGVAFLLFTAGVVYLLYGVLAVLPLHSKRNHATSEVAWSGSAAERSR